MTKRWIRVFFVLFFLNILMLQVNRFLEAEERNKNSFTYFEAETENRETEQEEREARAAQIATYQRMNCNMLGGFLEGAGTGFVEAGTSQYLQRKHPSRAEFTPMTDENSSFPQELVTILEETLYQHRNDTMGWFTEFSTLDELGAKEFKPDKEEKCLLFPQIADDPRLGDKQWNMNDSISETYGIPRDCSEIFHIQIAGGQDNYVFKYYPDGFEEDAVIVRLAERTGDEFITISEFEMEDLNTSYGVVIQYEKEFYYVYLLYNAQEKEFDGMKAHRLNCESDTNTLSIRYLPEEYTWDEIYPLSNDTSRVPLVVEDKMDTEFSPGHYLNEGTGKELEIYYGSGEKETSDFSEKFEGTLYEADIANCGLPVYVWKEYAPSPDGKSQFLKVSFYYYDSDLGALVKLSNLSVDEWSHQGLNLAQLWFDEIEGEIYTFRLYHVSEYSYLLSVVLMKGNKASLVRTYALSPSKEFHLSESMEGTGDLRNAGTKQESNSGKWLNTVSLDVMSEYASKYQRDFEVATKEIEERLYGVWKIKEFVGWTSSNRISHDGNIGDFVIFCEESWIDDGTPWFKPVYFCHSTSIEELSAEDFLNISWVDDRYDRQNAIYTIATYSEPNKAKSYIDRKPRLRLILLEDALIMEENESYVELEKIADIQEQDDVPMWLSATEDKAEGGNSSQWNNQECQDIISEYSTQFGCDFEIAAEEIENKLSGAWKIKEFVGAEPEEEWRFADRLLGDIYMFCEDAWVCRGMPWSKPVYFCCADSVGRLAGEDFLNITWTDRRYEGKDGILIIAISSGGNGNFGPALGTQQLRLMIIDDVLIVEDRGVYYEMEKVAELDF